jgi:putative membrane protein
MQNVVFSAVHLLALGVGLGAVYARGRAFRARDLEAAFHADNWWGIASLLWLGSGLYRAFGGIEKGSAYYLANHYFHAKMGLFLLVVLLELWPMVTLIRLRIQKSKGAAVDPEILGRFVRINDLEVIGVVILPFLAAAMARGYGM